LRAGRDTVGVRLLVNDTRIANAERLAAEPPQLMTTPNPDPTT